jgi:MOSC domain-containing protein YiiM
VYTGVWRNPITGRCRVERLNLEGDGQGDLAGHGGEHRAMFVYQIESYWYWQKQLNRNDFVYGQFGENFTIEGLPDDAVCIGDDFRSAPHFWNLLVCCSQPTSDVVIDL